MTVVTVVGESSNSGDMTVGHDSGDMTVVI
jgi:hypothetical protein